MKAGLAVEVVQVGADELAVLHADAGVVDEIGHAPRGVDPVEGTVGRARLGLDDLDPVLEALLGHHDPCQPRVRRRERDVELHRFPLTGWYPHGRPLMGSRQGNTGRDVIPV
jgi:hypothetical protein